MDALSAELTATESEAITAGGDKIRGEVESGRIAAALSQARAAGEMLSAERAQLAAQIAASEKAGADAAAEMEVLTRDSAALEEELRAISGSDDTFLETRTRLADELSDLKLKALAAQKDIESHRAAIAQLESRTDESDARARQLAANIETLTAQNAERAAQIETIRAAIAGSRNEIEKREEAKAGAVRRRMEKEGGITQQTARVRKITDEREALGREIARLTEQKEQKDAEYEQTVAKLWEEYELTLSAAQELCVPFESGAELRRQVSEVRGKIKALGNVNVSAIEEYAEVSQRYEFLRAQVGDVETSKAELQKLIAGLSDEMRAMFSESFAAINRNFGRIFAELAVSGGRGRCVGQRHQHRGGASGQDHPQPVGAVGRRTGAGGHLHLFRHFRCESRALLCAGRDRGRAGRRERHALCTVSAAHFKRDTVHRHHPPPRHHGRGRRAVRCDDAGGRRVQGAQAGPGACGREPCFLTERGNPCGYL